MGSSGIMASLSQVSNIKEIALKNFTGPFVVQASQW